MIISSAFVAAYMYRSRSRIGAVGNLLGSRAATMILSL
ncbi:hypothetical protein J2W14_004253 [Pseudarthrobacter oxydans]|nr:hypothetical protein [Pseudarthrobacter oxydans]